MDTTDDFTRMEVLMTRKLKDHDPKFRNLLASGGISSKPDESYQAPWTIISVLLVIAGFLVYLSYRL